MIKGQIGREAVMSGVSIEYTGRPSNYMGEELFRKGLKTP